MEHRLGIDRVEDVGFCPARGSLLQIDMGVVMHRFGPASGGYAKAATALLLITGTVGLTASASGAHASTHKSVVRDGFLCTVVGTRHADRLVGHAGDVVCGLGGNDTLVASGPGKVVLIGGPGRDTLVGSTDPSSDDVLLGDSGNDTLEGGDGQDSLDGGSGSDTIDAGDQGNDIIDGGSGNDVIDCGSGSSVVTVVSDSSEGDQGQNDDSQGDQENSDCQGSNVDAASQEWQGTVTSTDGATTMTVQWSDVSDAAQAWLASNGDPATVTFDLTGATIEVDGGGSLAVGDTVEVAATANGAVLTAVDVQAEAP